MSRPWLARATQASGAAQHARRETTSCPHSGLETGSLHRSAHADSPGPPPKRTYINLIDQLRVEGHWELASLIELAVAGRC